MTPGLKQGNRHGRLSGNSDFKHPDPVWKRDRCRNLMGWLSCRQKKNMVNDTLAENEFGQADVSVMYRIKCSAEYADFAIFSRYQVRQFDYPRTSPSP